MLEVDKKLLITPAEHFTFNIYVELLPKVLILVKCTIHPLAAKSPYQIISISLRGTATEISLQELLMLYLRKWENTRILSMLEVGFCRKYLPQIYRIYLQHLLQ